MDIFHHPACNTVLRAPPERPEVTDLPCWRGTAGALGHEDNPGQHIVMSFWKPSPEELALLNANGSVALQVWGSTSAPVYVGVCESYLPGRTET